jgi:hypothetical protein
MLGAMGRRVLLVRKSLQSGGEFTIDWNIT